MTLEKGKIITIIDKSQKYIGIIDNISSGFEVYFKVLITLEKDNCIISFNNHLSFQYLQKTEIHEPSDEETDILIIELNRLGIVLDKYDIGLYNLKIVG